jgi:outer membrane protein OmpA-like peptidoglycan-associated protein
MSASNLPRALRWRLVLPVSAAFVISCGGAKPPDAQTGGTTATTANAQPRGSVSPPTPSTVSISDEIRKRCGIADADAYFPFDSAHLTANDHTPLDLVVRCFTTGPLAGRSLKLVGRADPRGTSDYNFTLGQSRADAVAVYLSGRGMDRSRALATSRGAMDATGSNDAGWQHDRRVDVMLGN